MPYHAHLTFTPDAPHLDALHEQLSSQVRLTLGDEVPPDAHALVAGRPSDAQLAASDDLRLLLIPFAGLPAETRTRLAAYPHIAVHNLHHNVEMTAEMALTLLMAAARQIIPAHNTFQRGDWTPRYEGYGTNVMLHGKTALILGYGAIGRHVGGVCRALGMRVMGVRRHESDEADVYPVSHLRELLPRAHVVIITLPGTPETEGLLDADALASLPDGAILVNVGRAAVVDEAALFAALQSGKLHGAGLDVWYQYPQTPDERTSSYPAAQPFWTLDNVVLSPHRAGGLHNEELEQARMAGIARALNAAANGQPVPNPVDVGAGY